mmetsp:Transcript_18450/g.36919  ORF Transcript_18450/g.36919 Transcript_18450/m.36919 type:complete len:216 (+) Transcript_18450:146-793(+)
MLHIARVGGTSKVVIGGLVFVIVDSKEQSQKVFLTHLLHTTSTLLLIVGVAVSAGANVALVVLKVFNALDVDLLDLLFEEILLVQKQNHRRVFKETVVADFVEKVNGFHHTIRRGILVQGLIVFRQGSYKNNSCNIVKAMNPLLSLISLSTYIVHNKLSIIDDILLLNDTRRANTTQQDILLRCHVFRLHDAVNRVKIVLYRFYNLILCTTFPGC